MLADLLTSGVTQGAAVLLLAFLIYLAGHRTWRGFAEWLGVTVPTRRAMLWAVAGGLGIAATALGFTFVEALRPFHEHPSNTFRKVADLEPGWSTAVLAAVLYGFLKTGLSEELLFRGIFARRLIAHLGFRWGNLVQACLFGGMHLGLVFLAGVSVPIGWLVCAVFGATSAMGWLAGWLNERVADGSIAPGVMVHGLSNAVLYGWAGIVGW